MSTYPKKLNGLCVGILSGDRVLFQGPPDTVNGGYKQKILHLTGIQAPKVDTVTGNDEKFGFAARQYLRKRLVGKQHSFIVEKKVNETEFGYVMYEGKDISIDLLSKGYAKLRGENIKCDNIEDYKDAEEQARMAEVGIWSEDKKVEGAYRYLSKNADEKQIAKNFKGKTIKGIVEEIHPSKAQIYFPEQGIITTVTFSEVQVVVLSEKVSNPFLIIDNETVKSNVRQIRSVLESSFLQKQVSVHVTGYGQTLTGYLTNSNDEDVRKILLKNGFAKLGKDAMSTTNTKQFMELKKISQIALEGGKGLWKEQQVTKSQSLNQKSYIGTVIEVHSGDSLSVQNPQKNTIERVFFPNTRAPAANQPWAFEAKQVLRRKAIGQKVKVEVEFSKVINVKTGEGEKTQPRTFVYASVFLQNTNLACYLLEQGLLNLQPPRAEEDITKHLEDLKAAEERGKKQRRGVNSKQNVKIPNFNDLSGGKGKKIDASKAKNMFPFLKDEKNLTGVIDLVLNGSRFKVRFNQNSVMAVLVLDGVRALPNQGEFKKISEEALQFSKANALQRDIEIDLKKVDLKGVFQGVVYVSKKDYAIELLERGLAVCMGGKYANKKYEEAESLARKNKTGLWAYNFNLSAIRGSDGQKQFKQVNFSKNGSIIEVKSRYEFYVEPDGCKRVDVPQNPKPAEKVQVGGLYAAQFEGSYYRARVLKQVANARYQVFFVDYGNYETVAKAKIGELPENLKKQKSPIYRCSLYGLDGLTEEGEKTLKDLVGVSLKIEFKEQSEDIPNQDLEYRVILWEKNNCINLEFLQFGDAECTITSNEAWTRAEEKARQSRQGKWANDD